MNAGKAWGGALLCGFCMAVPATVGAQAPATPPPGLFGPPPCGEYTSVEPLDDGRVVFRLCAPEAGSASVTSSDTPAIPMFGGLPMSKDERGLWSATTAGPVPAGTYRYNFRVDGVRVVDPLATTYSEERRGNNATFETPGEEGRFQSYDRNVAHGTVAEVEYWSSSLGVKRRAHVYTPPGYMRDARRYPVLYLVHGAGDSDDSWTSVGHAHYILDNLIAAGKAKPMIVVMPFGHTPERGGPVEPARMLVNQDFADDFLKDLIPYVERNYRTVDDRRQRAMAGLSMGGAHTLQIGLTHPELFGYIGVFSMGLFGEEQARDYQARHGAALARGAKQFKRVRYYMGREDFLYHTVAPTRAVLDGSGIAYDYIETDGGHTWINWRRYLHDFLPYLFR